jgi:hypothetical protein
MLVNKDAVCFSVQTQLQSLEQLLHTARKREAAEKEEQRVREETHSAKVRTKTELKEAEAQVAENEKLAKQQLAEQKERKLQELREKWTANVVEKPPPRAKGAGKEGAGEGGGKRKGKKKSQQRSSDDEGGVDDGDEDEALLRALNAKPDARFGSSDEESDGPAAPREQRPRGAKSAVDVDDLFGDSDEEAAVGGGSLAGSDADAAAPSRKRLRKAGDGAGAAGADSDAELEGEAEGDTAAKEGTEGRARKQQRIVDDDSD